jgi:hypothetical protein
VRIPAWSDRTDVQVAGEAVSAVRPGHYLKLSRKWTGRDELSLCLNMGLRYESGDLDQVGHAALYRGPVLLAADSRFAPQGATPVDVSKLGDAKLVSLAELGKPAAGLLRPWLAVDVPTTAGPTLRPIDFASAGAATVEGQPLSTYRSWLPATGLRPPRPVAYRPADREQCGSGPMRFTWRSSKTSPGEKRTYAVVIASDPEFEHVALRHEGAAESSLAVPAEALKSLQPNTQYCWKIVATNEHGQSESVAPYKRFTIDPTKPPMPDSALGRAGDRLLSAAALQGDVQPSYGRLKEARGWKPCPGPQGPARGGVELDGQQGLVTFALEEFPTEDYAVSIWVSVTELPGPRLGQIFSAWSRGMDDPLRVVIHGRQLFARIEAGQFYGADGWKLETDKWYHVAAVKEGDRLTLYVDGVARSTARVPAVVASAADSFAIGGNPNYRGGPEFLAARLADLRLYARALTPEEVQTLFGGGAGKASP